jgi:hypothetical protein
MFDGSLIDDLFAVVRKAEKSARPSLPQESKARESSTESPGFADRPDRNSESE